jgi:hypothetical protein
MNPSIFGSTATNKISTSNVNSGGNESTQKSSGKGTLKEGWEKASVLNLIDDLTTRDGNKILLLGLSKGLKADQVLTRRGTDGEMIIKFGKACTVSIPQDPQAKAQVHKYQTSERVIKMLTKLNNDLKSTTFKLEGMKAQKLSRLKESSSEIQLNPQEKNTTKRMVTKKVVTKKVVIKKVTVKKVEPNKTNQLGKPPTRPLLTGYKLYSATVPPQNFSRSNILINEMKLEGGGKDYSLAMKNSCVQEGEHNGKKGKFYLLQSNAKYSQSVEVKCFFVSDRFIAAKRTEDRFQNIILRDAKTQEVIKEEEEVFCLGEATSEEKKHIQQAKGEQNTIEFEKAKGRMENAKKTLNDNSLQSRQNASTGVLGNREQLQEHRETLGPLEKAASQIDKIAIEKESKTYPNEGLATTALKNLVNEMEKPILFKLMAPKLQTFINHASRTLVDNLFKTPAKMENFFDGLGAFKADHTKMGQAILDKMINIVEIDGNKTDLLNLAECLKAFAKGVNDEDGLRVIVGAKTKLKEYSAVLKIINQAMDVAETNIKNMKTKN